MPYDELEKVFSDGGKGVFLPYKEFLELWGELNLKRAEADTKPPQEGIVSKAEYTGRVEGDVMVIDAAITVESFKKGWLTIPLARGIQLAAVGEAEAGKASLWSKPDGYDVIVPDKGVYELKLKLYAPVTKSAGSFKVPVGLPAAAVSRFTATVPGKGWEMAVTPAAAYTSRPVGENTEIAFFFAQSTNFEVTWSKTEAVTELSPLLLASTQVLSKVGTGSMTTAASVEVRILRAPVSEMKFSLPAGQEVLSVTGLDTKEWNLEPQGERQILTVTTNAPVKDRWHGTITMEAPLPKLPTTAPVPDVIVVGAAQDRGEVTLQAEPQLDVTPTAGEGMMQQTAQPAGAAEGLVSVATYRYLKHPAKVVAAVVPAAPQVDVDSLTRLTVERDRNRVETRFAYHIRRVGIFEARVVLPEGWSGWEVVGVPPERWTVEKTTLTVGGAQVERDLVVVRFDKQTVGQAAFTLQGQKQRANATEDVVVPVYAPAKPVERYEAKIGVAVHSSLEGTTKEVGGLRLEDVSSLNFNEIAAAPRQAAAAASPELTLAFRHRDAVAVPATLAFKPRAPQVNVQVLTLARIKEQSTLHQWKLVFDVGYAAIDKFILAVPAVAADDLRLVDPQVKEINKGYQAPEGAPLLPNAEAFTLWEVVLRNERQGSFEIGLSLERPASGEQTARVEVLQVHVPGVFQETGQVAVIKDDSLEIREPAPQNLEEIDPLELHSGLQVDGVFLAYKYQSQPSSLALELARNAYIEVPQAVVTHAVLTTAVATDRAQTTEVIYWVKNNARQFLTVRLPERSKLVSDVFVDTVSQRPMKREGSDDLLVRLPAKASVRTTAFPVRFVYEITSPAAGKKMGMMGSLHVLPPTLVDVSVVMQTHQSLFVPESHDYTKFKGSMTLSVKDRGWGRFRQGINALVPAFGPQFTQSSGDWTPAPGIPAQQRNTFDFQVPTQGRNFVLHRLGAPAGTEVSYRSRGFSFFLETVVFFLVVAVGLGRWSYPLADKFRYLLVFGLGGMLLTGLLSAPNAQVAKGAVLAAALMGILWTAGGILAKFQRLFSRGRRKPVTAPAAPLPATAPPMPPSPPEPTNTPESK